MPSDIKRQVRGIFVTPAGEPVTNKTLTFFRSRRVVTPAGDSTVVDEPFFATTDGTGLLDKEMLAGNYMVMVKLSDVDRYFNLAVPDEPGPHNPVDLLDYADPGDPVLTQVQQLVLKARAWAENPEDVEVDPTGYPGEYSARHYSKKSEESSIDAAASAAVAASREYIARSDLEAFVAGGGPIEQGRRYVADGVNYRGAAGATVLPALPGLLKMSKDCYLMEQFGSFSEGDDVSDVLEYCLEAAFADRASKVRLAPGEFFLASRVMAEWAANGPNAHVVDIQGAGCVLTLPPSNTDGGIRIATANNFQHLRIHDLLLLSSAPIGTIASATNGIALEVYSNLRPGDPGWGVTSGRQLEMNNVRAVSNNPGPNGRWDGGVYVDGFWFPLFNNVYVDSRWKNNGETTAEYESGDGVRIMNSYSPELIGCQSLGAFTHNIRIDENADMPYEDFQITGCYGVGGKDALTIRMSSAARTAAALKEPGGRISGGHYNGHRYAIEMQHRRQFTIDNPLLYTTIGGSAYTYPGSAMVYLNDCFDADVTVQCPEGGHYNSDSDCTRHVHLNGDTDHIRVHASKFGANGIAIANTSTGLNNKILGNDYEASLAPGTTGPTKKFARAPTSKQLSDNIEAFGGLEGVADKIPMFTGIDTMTLIDRPEELTYGSGPNGDYIRFSGGLQICMHTLTTSAGGITNWTFPAAFIGNGDGVDYSDVAARANNTPYVTSGAPYSGSNGMGVNAWDLSGNRVAVEVEVIAIGRWF